MAWQNLWFPLTRREFTRGIFRLPAAAQNHSHPLPQFYMGRTSSTAPNFKKWASHTNQPNLPWRRQLGSKRPQKLQSPQLPLLTQGQAGLTHLSLGLSSAKSLSTSDCRVTPEMATVSPPCHPQVPVPELERQNSRKCSQKVKNKNAIENLAKEGSALEAFLFSVWAWTCGKNNSHERTHRLSQYRWTINNAKAKRKIIDKFLLSSEQL